MLTPEIFFLLMLQMDIVGEYEGFDVCIKHNSQYIKHWMLTLVTIDDWFWVIQHIQSNRQQLIVHLCKLAQYIHRDTFYWKSPVNVRRHFHAENSPKYPRGFPEEIWVIFPCGSVPHFSSGNPHGYLRDISTGNLPRKSSWDPCGYQVDVDALPAGDCH